MCISTSKAILMKKTITLITLAFALLTLDSYNQNVGINADGANGDSNTMLDVKGTDNTSSGFGLKVKDSGGTDKFVVRNDGNVGVGTNAPGVNLEVETNANSDTRIRVLNSNTGGSAYTGLSLGNDLNSSAFSIITNSSGRTSLGGAGSANFFLGTNHPMSFFTNSLERMRIFSDGRVSIGSTNSTDASAKLYVYDATKAVIMAQGGFGSVISGSSTGRGLFGSNIYTENTSPFDYKTMWTHNGNYGYAAMEAGWGDLYFYAQPENTVADAIVSPTTRMIIQGSSGNIGIGSTSPSMRLYVHNGGTTSTQGAVGIHAQSGTQLHDVVTIGSFDGGVGDTWNLLNLETGNGGALGSGTSKFVVKATGDVGIGVTSPAERLDVNGNLRIGDLTSGTSMRIDGATGTKRFIVFRTGAVNRWLMETNEVAEAGSDAGSDFNIWRYTDAGVGNVAVRLERSTGNATFNGDMKINGSLDVATTTGAFIVPRMTTTQRDALTAVNGMIIYNTTTNQFNFRENGAWVLK